MDDILDRGVDPIVSSVAKGRAGGEDPDKALCLSRPRSSAGAYGLAPPPSVGWPGESILGVVIAIPVGGFAVSGTGPPTLAGDSAIGGPKVGTLPDVLSSGVR